MRRIFILFIITILLPYAVSASASPAVFLKIKFNDTVKAKATKINKIQRNRPSSKNLVTISPAPKSVSNTRHLKTVKAYQVDELSFNNHLSDSLTAVTLVNFYTGEKLSVYPYSPDSAKVEFASAKHTGRYIDMFSASPGSFYKISAAGDNVYKIDLFRNLENSSVKTIDSFVGAMSLSAYSPAIDTMRAPVKIREYIPDSLRARIIIVSLRPRLKIMGMDSLKLLTKKYKNDTLKAAIFGEIASRYMDYDTISNKRIRLSYQNNAVTYSTLAMQQYYKGGDSLGMRASFDNMAKVYYAQKKYSQAKWFILQSNSLSRGKNDIANVISSLITLSAIKSEINDYTLAMKDLNEAMALSIKYNYPKFESLVLKNYALLYSRMKNYPKEELVLKKRDSLEAQIQRKEQDSLLSGVAAADSLQSKKIDSVQVKKKVYTSSTRKLSKASSVKKIASL